MPAEVAAEAVQLLEELRRVREDSLRVAEYGVSLQLALTGHRIEQSEKATKEWRAAEEGRVMGHLHGWENYELDRLAISVIWQWAFIAQSTKALAPTIAATEADNQLLHEYFDFRHARLVQSWKRSTQKCQDDLEKVLKAAKTNVEGAQRRLEELKDTNLRRRMSSVQRHIGTRVVKSTFASWYEFVLVMSFSRKKQANFRKTINMIWAMEAGDWLAQCYAAWTEFVGDILEKRGDAIEKCKAIELKSPMQMVIFGADQNRLLHMVIREWRDVTEEGLEEQRVRQQEIEATLKMAEAQLKIDQENELMDKFPDKIFSKTLALLAFDVVDVKESFFAWKQVSIVEPAKESLIKKALKKAQVRKACDRIFRSFLDRSLDYLDDMELENSFTTWCCCWELARRRSRRATEKECSELTEGIQAWDAQGHEVVAWRKLKRMVDAIDVRRLIVLRTTVQSLYRKAGSYTRRKSKEVAIKDMEVARTKLATASLENKIVTDKITDLHAKTRQWQNQTRHAMIRFCVERRRECVMLMLLQWRLIVCFLRSQSREMDKEARISYLEDGIVANFKDSEEAHKITAVNVMGRLVSQLICAPVFYGWRLGIRVSVHDKKVEAEDKVWAEKKMQIRRSFGQQIEERTQRHNTQMSAIQASVLMKVFAASSSGVHMAFMAWKNVIVSALPRKMARVILESGSRRQHHSISRAALHYWRLSIDLERHEADAKNVAEVAWLDMLMEQRRSRNLKLLGDLISRNLDLPLLREALALWRKLHDVCCVDKAAYDVQSQWSKWELDVKSKLQRVAASCSALAVFSVHKLRQDRFQAIAYIALNTWRLSAESCKANRQFAARQKAAQDAFEAQKQFETFAREQWIEKCLFARAEALNSHDLSQLLHAWHWFVKAGHKKTITTSRNFEQAQSLLQCGNDCRHSSRAQVAFAGWHGAACRSRRRWFKRQCRRLEVELDISGDPNSRKRSVVGKLPVFPATGPAFRPPPATTVTLNPALPANLTSLAPAQAIATNFAGVPTQTGIAPTASFGGLSAVNATDPSLDDFAKKLKSFTFGLGQRT